MSLFSLDTRIALVTGASGGLGRAIAQTLCAQGAHVILTGRRMEALEALAQVLPSKKATILAWDLQTPQDAMDLMGAAETACGPIDILVNNAGITRDGLVMRMEQAQWEEVLRINLTLPFVLAQGLFRGMVKRRFGRIINISSIVASSGNIGQCNYTAAKAGLEGMTRSLALEGAKRGVTVNAIAPGFIETSMTASLQESYREALLTRIPMNRMGTPEDIAATVAFVASAEASYITGQVFHVNGGMWMG